LRVSANLVLCFVRLDRVALGVRVTLGGCHLLDCLVDCGSVEAHKEIVRGSGEGFVWGIVLTPRGSRRATLVEHVIELPHLRVVSWCA
jgi:hypothetical protein